MAPTIGAVPLQGSIRVDGVLDDAAWATAEPFTDFVQRDPDEGEPGSERTEVRILVGADALYIGARMYDSEPGSIRAALARRDVVSDFDYVIVNLDSRHDHNTSYSFGLTPSGAYQDAVYGAGGYDFAWDPVWEGRAKMDGEGWSAEWRIPFSQLRFDTRWGGVWGIQIARMIARKRELLYFSLMPRNETSGPHRYGHLVGLENVQEPDRLELLPFATVRSEHLNVDPDDPFRSDADQSYGVGLDLKYGLSGNLTLDATVNPDFGQVEVDPAVINLTQYETFFPERRPFFLEGAEIFHDLSGVEGSQLFYSRRIGRPPQVSPISQEARYSDVPGQTTIGGAVKVSGRAGEWSLGVLDAVTLEEEAPYVDAEGLRQTAVAEPATNYLVGRARRDFREGNSTVGGILGAVNRNLSDPGAEALLHSSAYVAGVDFNHSWQNRGWYVRGSLAGSRVQGSEDALLRTQRSSARYWQRPDAGHVEVDPNRTSMGGWRGSVGTGRMSGEHWVWSGSLQAHSPGFEPNDLGYGRRVDAWEGAFGLQYRDLEPDERTRFYDVDLSGSFARNFDGDLVGVEGSLSSTQRWANYWTTATRIAAHPEYDEDRMTRGGPVARMPAGYSIYQSITADQRKPYSAFASAAYSRNLRGGHGIFLNGEVILTPVPAMEINLGPAYQRIHSVGQYLTTVADPTADRTYGARYVFSDLHQVVLSLDTRVSWTFTPRLSLQMYLQPFLATGDYSRFKELHEPRRWDWDVYGEEVGTIIDEKGLFTISVDPDGAGPAQLFTFNDPDFNVRSLRGNAVLRWEYRPGSTLYLVWQQRRYDRTSAGVFELLDDMDALWNTPPENVFALKVSYWLGR